MDPSFPFYFLTPPSHYIGVHPPHLGICHYQLLGCYVHTGFYPNEVYQTKDYQTKEALPDPFLSNGIWDIHPNTYYLL